MAVPSREDAWAEPAPPFPPSASSSHATSMHQGLRAVDEVVLALLGTHEVLTSGQLVRLTGLPERTVQHHLGLLYRAGLVNRVRPPREVGTSPYHCWLTTFGAAAIGAEKPGARSDDPAGVQATAALSELWLAVPTAGRESASNCAAGGASPPASPTRTLIP